MMNAPDSTSTRPYLIRALYEWCTDNGFTPYVAVLVDDTVQVPREYVKNGEIVLNVSFDATSSLKLGNEFIEFKARFAGTARQIMVPVEKVLAIYARENGQGMAFPVPVPTSSEAARVPQVPDTSTEGPVSSASALDVESKTIQLVSTDTVSDVGSDDDTEPPKPAGPRPALKRVK
jgi:stringent starvation protein B